MDKIISGHQPSYLPWLGYINKIVRCDKFVLMDDVQFARRDYIHKNIIVSRNSPILLSIPIAKSHEDSKISDVSIASTALFLSKNDWQYQHLNSIRHAYRRAPYFNEVFPLLENIYTTVRYSSLLEVTNTMLDFILDLLSIPSSRIVRMSSDLCSSTAHKDKLIFDHCRQLGASKVLFGSHGRDYVDVQYFREHGIEVLFQDYNHPVYVQFQTKSRSFIEKACFIDALMNLGHMGFGKLIKESL